MELKYLGTILTEDDDITIEIKQQRIIANKLAELKKWLNSPNLKCQTKCMLYETLTRLILAHGSE